LNFYPIVKFAKLEVNNATFSTHEKGIYYLFVVFVLAQSLRNF